MGTDSRAAGALLARARTLHLQTGNLLNWGRLRKKCPSTHSEEEFPDVLECTVSHAVEKINPDEREEMKVSAKLFIVGSNSSSSTRNAIDMACSVLGVAQLDSVIIASPPIEDGVNLSLEHLQPYWEELENLVQSKKIVAIGTSDLDKTQLEQLYQWAQVKPNSNQVNLASCCVMPPDLTAFAKQFDIQLLTHNDPKGSNLVPPTCQNCSLKQVSKKLFRKAFLTFKHMSFPPSIFNLWRCKHLIYVLCIGEQFILLPNVHFEKCAAILII
ncbi:glutamate--cysteine ligase regulatory subunit isoform X3 [Ictidomys tridecemlineatus]